MQDKCSKTINLPSKETLDAISFLGNSLALFFKRELFEQGAHENFEAFRCVDTTAAANEWPFANVKDVQVALYCIQQGLDSTTDEELMWEFRRMFVGPFEKAVPPWGSVYTDRDCVVFGDSTLKLKEFMHQKGIIAHGKQGAPEDHIGLMLSMMSWIAQNKPDVLVEYLKEHLLTWSFHFLDEMFEKTEYSFFKGAAQLTEASLEGIQRKLAITIDYPTFFR